VTLSREDCYRELGLLPVWRLRGEENVAPAVDARVADVAPASLPASSRQHLTQGVHSRGYLPHVKAKGATYFVTFRLADSLPAAVLATWASLPEADRVKNTERYLDQGAGECLLARPEVAEIVLRALTYHADSRYTLHEYVFMPNHVHVLLTPLAEHALSDILHSLKSWTAQKINALLNRVGSTLWQHESYDHVVRDDDELQTLCAYVRLNPVKAGLCADEAGFRWSSAWNKDAGKDAGATVAAPPVAQASPPASVQNLDWPELAAAIKSCTLCDLHKSRTQGVPGVGDVHADWLFIGEAPGAEEDRQGEPFVGQAGKLLDAMLGALRLKRGENVYIANVLKSRPPGNRDPKPEEVAACLPYLLRQIDLIRPKIIVAVGRIAAQNLLKTDTPIGKLRGRVHTFHGVPLVVTYHPAYLLRSPADKAKAWDDLVLATTTMNSLKAGPQA
jgi:DNA polymerase